MRVYKANVIPWISLPKKQQSASRNEYGYTKKACGIAGLNLIAVITGTCKLNESCLKVVYSSNGSDSQGATKIKVDLYARKDKGKFQHVRSTYGTLSPCWSDDSKEAISYAIEILCNPSYPLVTAICKQFHILRKEG